MSNMSNGGVFKMDSMSLGYYNFTSTTQSYQHVVGQMQQFNGFVNPAAAAAAPNHPNQMMQHMDLLGTPPGPSNQMQHLNLLANAAAACGGASNQMQNLSRLAGSGSSDRMRHMNLLANAAAASGASSQMQHLNLLANAAAASGASNQMQHLNVLANAAATPGAFDQMQNSNRLADPGSSNRMQHLNALANAAATSGASNQMKNLSSLVDSGSSNQMQQLNLLANLADTSGASNQMQNFKRLASPGSSNQMQHLNALENAAATSSPSNQVQNLNRLANHAVTSGTSNQMQQMTVLADPENAAAPLQPVANQMQDLTGLVNPVAGQPQPANDMQNLNTSGPSLPLFGSLNFNRPTDTSSTVHKYNLRTKRAPSVVEIDDIDDDHLFGGNQLNHQVTGYSHTPPPLQQQSETNYRQQQRQRGQVQRKPQQRTRGGGGSSRGGGKASRGFSGQTRLRPVAPRSSITQFDSNLMIPVNNYGHQQNMGNPYADGAGNQMALGHLNRRQHYLGGKQYRGFTNTVDLTRSQEPHLVMYNGGTVQNRRGGTMNYGALGSSTFQYIPTNSVTSGNSLSFPQRQQPNGYASRSATTSAAGTALTSGINPNWGQLRSEYNRPSNNSSPMLSQGQNHSLAVSALKRQLQNQSRNVPPSNRPTSRTATPSADADPVTTGSYQPSSSIGNNNSLSYSLRQSPSLAPLRKQLMEHQLRYLQQRASASRAATTPSAAAETATSSGNNNQLLAQVKTKYRNYTPSAAAPTVNLWNNNQPPDQLKTEYKYNTPSADASTATSWNNNQPLDQVKTEYKYNTPSADAPTAATLWSNNQPLDQVKTEYKNYTPSAAAATTTLWNNNQPPDRMKTEYKYNTPSADVSTATSWNNNQPLDWVKTEYKYNTPSADAPTATSWNNNQPLDRVKNDYKYHTPSTAAATATMWNNSQSPRALVKSECNYYPTNFAKTENSSPMAGDDLSMINLSPPRSVGNAGAIMKEIGYSQSDHHNSAPNYANQLNDVRYCLTPGNNLSLRQGNGGPRALRGVSNQNATHGTSQGNRGFDTTNSEHGKYTGESVTDLGMFGNQNVAHRISQGINPPSYDGIGKLRDERMTNLGEYQNVVHGTPQGSEGFNLVSNDRKCTGEGMTGLGEHANRNMVRGSPQGNEGFNTLNDKHKTGLDEYANRNMACGTPQGNEGFNPPNSDRGNTHKLTTGLDEYASRNMVCGTPQGNEGLNPPNNVITNTDKQTTSLGEHADRNMVHGTPQGNEGFNPPNDVGNGKFTDKRITDLRECANQNVVHGMTQGSEEGNRNVRYGTPQGNEGFNPPNGDSGNSDKLTTGLDGPGNQNVAHGTPQGKEGLNHPNIHKQYIDEDMADLDKYMADCYKKKLTGDQQDLPSFESISPVSLDSFFKDLGTEDLFDADGNYNDGGTNHTDQPSSGCNVAGGVTQTNSSHQNQQFNSNYGSQQTNNVFSPAGQGGNGLIQNIQNNVTYNIHQGPCNNNGVPLNSNRSAFWNASGQQHVHPYLPTSYFTEIFMPWERQVEEAKPPPPATDGSLSLGAQLSQAQNVVNQNYFDASNNYGLPQQGLQQDPPPVGGDKQTAVEPKYPEIDLTDS